jgi:hypothetical protein
MQYSFKKGGSDDKNNESNLDLFIAEFHKIWSVKWTTDNLKTETLKRGNRVTVCNAMHMLVVDALYMPRVLNLLV